MSKNEKKQFPILGNEGCNIRNENNLEKSLKKAEKEKETALRMFENSRSYLMKCTRQVQDIKAKIYFSGKEVYHG